MLLLLLLLKTLLGIHYKFYKSWLNFRKTKSKNNQSESINFIYMKNSRRRITWKPKKNKLIVSFSVSYSICICTLSTIFICLVSFPCSSFFVFVRRLHIILLLLLRCFFLLLLLSYFSIFKNNLLMLMTKSHTCDSTRHTLGVWSICLCHSVGLWVCVYVYRCITITPSKYTFFFFDSSVKEQQSRFSSNFYQFENLSAAHNWSHYYWFFVD